MAPKTSADKPVKKTKSGGGGKRLSPYNKFMKTELARLKETEPNMAHMDRFKLAAGNWKNAKK
ncbi:hypothetical protein PILCRDRAFT_822979 [Piloderma croceum F 1598]|uniref:YABBY protein C-terminal domain-containing protein n=1 Tax=Piloderma croceum (strain F 1598) TaxID=765440 RepID=A0A0C3B0P2_PILCF|nr:hypothetical protein PILCRDRAFT_822979 [Piloderma croceum F 1598]